MKPIGSVRGYARDRVITTFEVSKGHTIYEQGDPACYWFEVLSGMVATAYVSPDGRRQITGFFCAGEVIGADQGLYESSAEVKTDVCRVRRVPWGGTEDYEQGLERALLSARHSILILGQRTAAAQISALLLDLHMRTGSGPSVPLPMTQRDIADYLGLTVETVSRTFAMLAKRKLVVRGEPHLARIMNMKKLQDLAGDDGR